MSTYTEDLRKVTTRRLAEMKQRGEKNIYAYSIRLFYGQPYRPSRHGCYISRRLRI